MIVCSYLQVLPKERVALDIQNFFLDHRLRGSQLSDEIPDLGVEFIPQTIYDQVNFIGNLSNNNYGHRAHTARQLFLSISMERKRAPLSPRNRLIYYHQNSDMANFQNQLDELRSGRSSASILRPPKPKKKDGYSSSWNGKQSEVRWKLCFSRY